jgi:hypothetical protein
VTNNVVVTSACHGITYGIVHGGKVVNNTVLDDGSDAGTKNAAGKVVCCPGITIADKTHQGSSSNDVIIRNNIANGLSIYDVNPNMTMDHNICATIDGKCTIITFVGGKPNWGVNKPGHGVPAACLSTDPPKFLYDVRLRPEAGAIGAGNAAEAPPVDIAERRAEVASMPAPTNMARANRRVRE